MIQWLRDLPIRRKLTTVITATSAVALIVASGMLLTWDVIRFRADLRVDLQTLTTIIADNSTAALSFNYPAAATETLAALAAKPQITAAAIYRNNGELFAAYKPDGGPPVPEGPPPEGLRELTGAVEIVRPIVMDGTRLGTIYVRTSLAAGTEGSGSVCSAKVTACSEESPRAPRGQAALLGPLASLAIPSLRPVPGNQTDPLPAATLG